MNTNKNKVLVTGAAGFIGSHLVRGLQQNGGFEVVALDDLSGGYQENIPPHTNFIAGSVTDVELIDALFAEHKFRYVYHLAAYAAEGLSHFIRRYNYETNLVGTMNLINGSINQRVERFIFASSIAVYGAGQVPMREDMTPVPEDPYGISKYACELDLKNAHEMFGLDFVIFRPHNVYGEYQNIGDRYRNVVGIFMNQILRGEPMSIFGDGEQQRAFSYVGDLVEPMIQAATLEAARNEVFNVGADTPYTVNELSAQIASAMGVSSHPVMKLPARNEVKVAFSDHSKAHAVFGTRNSTSLEDGLERMAAWVKRVGSRQSPKFSKIEVSRNLPEFWNVG
jgi:UDP-glucose 4-epimerase